MHVGCDGWRRITDLSMMSAERIKNTNRVFFTDIEHEYTSHLPENDIKRKISSVRNGDLRRVMREFEMEAVDEPLYVQCALWVHAFTGKQFFEDANHRTANLSIKFAAIQNGIDFPSFPEEVVEPYTQRSKDLIRQRIRVRMDTLWRRDDLYIVWRDFYAKILPDRD